MASNGTGRTVGWHEKYTRRCGRSRVFSPLRFQVPGQGISRAVLLTEVSICTCLVSNSRASNFRNR